MDSSEKTYPLRFTRSEVVALWEVLGSKDADALKEEGYTPELFDQFSWFAKPYKSASKKVEALWRKL